MRTILLILLPLFAFCQKQDYSLSATAQHAFGRPSVGLSAIMEGSAASFECHALVDGNFSANVQFKLGVTVFSDCSSRWMVYPFYFNYEGGDYFTPVGMAWTTTKGPLTFNMGADIYKKSEIIEGITKKGKIRPTLNASISVRMFGKRYKK